MTIHLGAGIDWSHPVVALPEPVVVVVEPDPAMVAATRIEMAVVSLIEAVRAIPRPEIVVDIPELAQMVNAVQGLKGPATAEEIAEALARKLTPAPPTADTGIVEAIRELVEKVDFRLKGIGTQAYGGGGMSVESLATAVNQGLTSYGAATGSGGTGLTNTQLRAAAVEVVDAAEDATLTAVPFSLTTTGAGQILVAAPGAGIGRLRLRRISPTYAIRSPNSEPILSLKIGTVEAQRGNALTGRFDITAATGTNAITLDIDTLDVGGVVIGTLYYEVVA